MPRRLPLFVFAVVAVSCGDAEVPRPVSVDTPETFEVVEGWAQPPPSGPYGRVLGVAVAPDGRVWVSHTADGEARNSEPIKRPTLVVLDPATGAVLEERGGGTFRLPHALAFDGEGRLWVTDADSNRIVALGASGEVLLEIGADP